jgi:hypothetical protein
MQVNRTAFFQTNTRGVQLKSIDVSQVRGYIEGSADGRFIRNPKVRPK